jgi:GAF domain/Phosphoserine phosphatase RsbU, N-terminal domain
MRRFDAAYRDAFRDYLRDPGEATLRAAYELGRDAVRRELTVLDLALAHHDALASELRGEGQPGGHEQLVRAAGAFFLESIASFDMVQRGFREARDAALLERRHAHVLRQLSDFLADASLALDASNSLAEMLRLIAEQARELIPADCCLVATRGDHEAPIRAASHPDDDLRWATFARWVDLSQLDALVRSADRPTRSGAEEIATHIRVPGSGPTKDLVLRDWLATPLAALDGRAIGSIHLVTEREAGFTGLHEAVVQHLAQLGAAAIERSQLYSGRPA